MPSRCRWRRKGSPHHRHTRCQTRQPPHCLLPNSLQQRPRRPWSYLRHRHKPLNRCTPTRRDVGVTWSIPAAIPSNARNAVPNAAAVTVPTTAASGPTRRPCPLALPSTVTCRRLANGTPTLDDAAEFDPTHEGTPVADMLKTNMEAPLAALIKAVDDKSSVGFSAAFDKLMASCNACHAGAQHAFPAADHAAREQSGV